MPVLHAHPSFSLRRQLAASLQEKPIAMNRILGLGLLGTALAAAGLPALAQSPAPSSPAQAAPAQAAPAQAAPAQSSPSQTRVGRGPHGPARLLAMADADRDGRVSETEALNALSAHFAEADADRDGGLTREEVTGFLRSQWEARQGSGDRRAPPDRARHAMEGRLDALFRAADADRDGRVTMDELRPIALAMFRATDRNNDGALDASELRGHRGPRPPR
jgi:hypothetical protein